VKRSVPALSTLISPCTSVQGTVPTSGVTPVSLDNGTTIVGPNCLLDSDSFSFFLSIDRARKRKDRLLAHTKKWSTSLAGEDDSVRQKAGWLADCTLSVYHRDTTVRRSGSQANECASTTLPSSASCVPLLIPLPSALLPPAGATVSPLCGLPSTMLWARVRSTHQLCLNWSWRGYWRIKGSSSISEISFFSVFVYLRNFTLPNIVFKSKEKCIRYY